MERPRCGLVALNSSSSARPGTTTYTPRGFRRLAAAGRGGETRVENPRELVEWNSDKRYLGELAEADVPTIPTIWAEVGEEDEAAEEARRRGWDQDRCQARGGLGADGCAGEFRGGGRRPIREIGEPCLVQPYLESLSRSGELSLVYFRGELSHAVLKTPAEGDFRIHEHLGGTYRTVDPPDRRVACR